MVRSRSGDGDPESVTIGNFRRSGEQCRSISARASSRRDARSRAVELVRSVALPLVRVVDELCFPGEARDRVPVELGERRALEDPLLDLFRERRARCVAPDPREVVTPRDVGRELGLDGAHQVPVPGRDAVDPEDGLEEPERLGPAVRLGHDDDGVTPRDEVATRAHRAHVVRVVGDHGDLHLQYPYVLRRFASPSGDFSKRISFT